MTRKQYKSRHSFLNLGDTFVDYFGNPWECQRFSNNAYVVAATHENVELPHSSYNFTADWTRTEVCAFFKGNYTGNSIMQNVAPRGWTDTNRTDI